MHCSLPHSCRSKMQRQSVIHGARTSLLHHVDVCMHVMKTAARCVEELAALRGECIQFAEHLKQDLVAARLVLDERMLACREMQVKSALLPALDFDTELARLEPFQVVLPKQDSWAAKQNSTLRQRSIDALCGLTEPHMPAMLCSTWCRWIQFMEKRENLSWSNCMLCQHVVSAALLCLH